MKHYGHVSRTCVLLSFIVIMLASCTSIGGLTSKPDMARYKFGPPLTMRICILRDPAVSEEQAKNLMKAWQEEITQFNLTLSLQWIHPWPRPAFGAYGLMEAIAEPTMEAPCDRLVALIGRNAGDAIYSLMSLVLPMPEILGYVDNVTQSRSFIIATWGPSINQVFAGGPEAVMIHEGYHLLGCGHNSWSQCYDSIAETKRLARTNQQDGIDFFPSRTVEGVVFLTREKANTALALGLALYRSGARNPEPPAETHKIESGSY